MCFWPINNSVMARGVGFLLGFRQYPFLKKNWPGIPVFGYCPWLYVVLVAVDAYWSVLWWLCNGLAREQKFEIFFLVLFLSTWTQKGWFQFFCCRLYVPGYRVGPIRRVHIFDRRGQSKVWNSGIFYDSTFSEVDHFFSQKNKFLIFPDNVDMGSGGVGVKVKCLK